MFGGVVLNGGGKGSAVNGKSGAVSGNGSLSGVGGSAEGDGNVADRVESREEPYGANKTINFNGANSLNERNSDKNTYNSNDNSNIANEKPISTADLKDIEKLVVAYIGKEESINEEMLFVRLAKNNTHEDRVIHNKNIRETWLAICSETGDTRETLAYGFEDIVSRENQTKLDKASLPKIVDIKAVSHILSSGRKIVNLKDFSFQYANFFVPARVSSQDVKQVLDLLEIVYEAISEQLAHESFQKKGQEISVKLAETGFDLSALSSQLAKNSFLAIHTYIENYTSIILSEMENRGVKVDVEKLKAMKEDLSKELEGITDKIYSIVGHEFNINSPKQLSDVLYNQLHIPTQTKGKRAFSTREEVLEELQDTHPIITHILEYREVAKLLSTYVEAFLMICEKNCQQVVEGGDDEQSVLASTDKSANTEFFRDTTFLESTELPGNTINSANTTTPDNPTPSENVIKTDFKQFGTTSGRFSSINPNMQNIPLLGDWAKRFREVFIARDGYDLISIDYSQIEFRIMAHVSRDKNVMSDFLSEKDIHKSAASRIFSKPEEEITVAERQSAKTINFAILYGQTAFGLSRQLKISQADASKYLSQYFNDYKGVAQYIEQAGKDALEKGYVETMLGRRRYVLGLDSQNKNVRSSAIREAINMPIQGSGADLVKLSMIAVRDLIHERYEGKVFMLLQIHDELLFEAQEGVSKEFARDASEIMEKVYKFDVPLKVHSSIGKNLAEVK